MISSEISPSFDSKNGPTKFDRPSFVKQMIVQTALAMVILVSFSFFILSGKINLAGDFSEKLLTLYPKRLEFVFKFQPLNLLWLLFVTISVIHGRFITGVVNPLDFKETAIQKFKQIHQNSIEQYILLIFNQLTLTTTLSSALFLRVIPLMNMLFFVGRIVYWFGYPMHRATGFAIGFLPIMISTLYNVYAFFTMNFLKPK